MACQNSVPQLPSRSTLKPHFHRNRLLQSPFNLPNQHIQLAQHWRMTRRAPFHLRLSPFRRQFLLPRKISLVTRADEVSRGDVIIRSACERGLLGYVWMWDKARFP